MSRNPLFGKQEKHSASILYRCGCCVNVKPDFPANPSDPYQDHWGGGEFLCYICYIEEFLLVLRVRADLAVSLTLTQSVEVRGCCSWSNPGVSYGRHTHSVFLSNSLNPFLFSSLKRHVFPPIFCIHLHFEIYIFLALNVQLMGPGVNHRFAFFVACPLSRLSRCASCKKKLGSHKASALLLAPVGVSSNELLPQR